MSGPFVLLYCIVSGLKFRSLPKHYVTKVECILLMTVISILPRAEFGHNNDWEDAPDFRCLLLPCSYFRWLKSLFPSSLSDSHVSRFDCSRPFFVAI